MKALAGAAVVVLGAVVGGVLGGVVGHVAGGGDKNVGLTVALYCLIAGSVVALGVLGRRSQRTRDWRPFLGGVLAFALGAAGLARLILGRLP